MPTPSGLNTNSRSLRILIVDDEALIRWSLAQTLGDAGHVTTEAADGASAIRSVSQTATPFDVVLLDFRLPDSNDLGLLSELRRLAPTSKVILMTAFSTPDVVDGALELGAVRVVTKPMEMVAVPGLVQRACGAGE